MVLPRRLALNLQLQVRSQTFSRSSTGSSSTGSSSKVHSAASRISVRSLVERRRFLSLIGFEFGLGTAPCAHSVRAWSRSLGCRVLRLRSDSPYASNTAVSCNCLGNYTGSTSNRTRNSNAVVMVTESNSKGNMQRFIHSHCDFHPVLRSMKMSGSHVESS